MEKYADKAPRLMTGDLDLDLRARQILVLSEGVMDAFVLVFFESARPEEKRSQDVSDVRQASSKILTFVSINHSGWIGRTERLMAV